MSAPVEQPRRPLKPTPDVLRECQAYCEELKQLVWDADRKVAALRAQVGGYKMRWTSLRVDAIDLDRQGHAMDVVSFMRKLEDEWPALDPEV